MNLRLTYLHCKILRKSSSLLISEKSPHKTNKLIQTFHSDSLRDFCFNYTEFFIKYCVTFICCLVMCIYYSASACFKQSYLSDGTKPVLVLMNQKLQ